MPRAQPQLRQKIIKFISIFMFMHIFQLLPGMVYTLFTAVFTCFIIFRTVYQNEANVIIMAVLNLIWGMFHITFLIAAIYFGDTATKAVSVLCFYFSYNVFRNNIVYYNVANPWQLFLFLCIENIIFYFISLFVGK